MNTSPGVAIGPCPTGSTTKSNHTTASVIAPKMAALTKSFISTPNVKAQPRRDSGVGWSAGLDTCQTSGDLDNAHKWCSRFDNLKGVVRKTKPHGFLIINLDIYSRIDDLNTPDIRPRDENWIMPSKAGSHGKTIKSELNIEPT